MSEHREYFSNLFIQSIQLNQQFKYFPSIVLKENLQMGNTQWTTLPSFRSYAHFHAQQPALLAPCNHGCIPVGWIGVPLFRQTGQPTLMSHFGLQVIYQNDHTRYLPSIGETGFVTGNYACDESFDNTHQNSICLCTDTDDAQHANKSLSKRRFRLARLHFADKLRFHS